MYPLSARSMSVTDFYRTFYQTDQLYRLADESWEPSKPVAVDVADPVAMVASEIDLLAELDMLSANGQPTAQVITPEPEPSIISVQFPAESAAEAPEVLPDLAPRPKVPQVVPPLQQKPRLPLLNHKVLLLADEELDPSNLLFLEKILKAVNLNIDGVDLLNLHGVKDMDFAELLRGKYINHFITFGVPFERINLDIMMDRYSPVRFEGITFLMADSLPTIEADQNLKKRLWTALQRVFLR
ncbi:MULTISPECIES: hypothetical protein [unclassified Spirosoma]|uniref:hypothetical protein n=1 Tax=unclassified Spirosoma TaxID=2621999 RepID=UPI0025EF9327|nr:MULTISPECIES: hypothetical protein [unclassified Spirosoma]